MRAAAIALAIGAGSLIAPGEQTRTVSLTVAVIRPDGQFAAGLGQRDFTVTLDGVPVEVRSATPLSAPPHVLVLLDLTASAMPSAGGMRELIEAEVLSTFSAADRIRVTGFGRQLVAPGDWSSDRREQRRALREVLAVPQDQRNGPSPIWDVLDQALTTLIPRDARTGVLLVTDGQATGNRRKLGDVADRALALDVPIHVVFVGFETRLLQTPGTMAAVRPDRVLKQLAEATGGAYFARPRFPSKPRGKEEIDPLRFADNAFRNAYRLEVSAPVKAGFQRVAVTTPNPDHVVRVRLGIVLLSTPAKD